MLREILSIESQIHTVKTSPRYLRIKRNLASLESMRFGAKLVSVQSVDEPNDMLEIRPKSQEMREIISGYRNRREEFDLQLDELYVRKERLTEQLFKASF